MRALHAEANAIRYVPDAPDSYTLKVMYTTIAVHRVRQADRCSPLHPRLLPERVPRAR